MDVKVVALNVYADGAIQGDIRMHLSEAAWMESRPESKDSLEKILSIDAPVNEMPSAVLKIRSSAVIREVITSIREHVMWATTSRISTIDQLRNFEVPESFGEEYKEFFEDIRRDISNAGTVLSIDNARLFLPAIHMTEYMVRLSLRSIVKLRHQFDIFANKTGDGGVGKMFEKAALALDPIIERMDFGVGIKSMIKYTPLLRSVPSSISKQLFIPDVKRVHDNVSLRLHAPFSLRTHVTRHRALHLRDELSYFIRGNLAALRLNTLINMEIFADIDTWENVIRIRSCWIAQFNLWEKIVKPVANELGALRSLPCDNGFCPYSVDAERRLGSDDPGTPCPIYLRLTGRVATALDVRKMHEHVRNDHRYPFWHDEIKKVTL